jgi:ubiquinone/menaquinone biosynthesis C-methylase UbiE
LRRYLLAQAGLADLPRPLRLLEVGCGTGAVLGDLAELPQARRFGLDISLDFLRAAQGNLPAARLALGDGRALPFAPQVFDLSLCHYLLLWVESPLEIVRQMRRVTRPGGMVLALAEPDYGGRIDYPPALQALGEAQQAALRRQGADPWMGRKLKAVFHQAGLIDVRSGVIGGEWSAGPTPLQIESEWQVLVQDLRNWLPSDTIEAWQQADLQAWQRGERILFVPTFYAAGRVPA